MSSGRPLLFLDVDGTLLPYLPRDADGVTPPPPEGFELARAGGVDAWVPTHLREALPSLCQAFETIWCTDWEAAANVQVAPLFGMPGDLPVLFRERSAKAGWWKFAAVTEVAGDRPLVWADDDMRPSAREWARQRDADTLALTPTGTHGLSRDELAEIVAFADRHGVRIDRF
jgi:hypothetical protein